MESETMTITEICSLTGINLHTLKFRLWKWKIKPVSLSNEIGTPFTGINAIPFTGVRGNELLQ